MPSRVEAILEERAKKGVITGERLEFCNKLRDAVVAELLNRGMSTNTGRDMVSPSYCPRVELSIFDHSNSPIVAQNLLTRKPLSHQLRLEILTTSYDNASQKSDAAIVARFAAELGMNHLQEPSGIAGKKSYYTCDFKSLKDMLEIVGKPMHPDNRAALPKAPTISAAVS